MIESTLLAAAERFHQSPLRPIEALRGGDEAIAIRLEAASGQIVLHVSPSWRTRAELEWVHAVARRVHERVPEAVKPIRGHNGTVFDWEGRWAALFPFIEGNTLDREDPALRTKAAQLLASVHNALLHWQMGPRPDSHRTRPIIPAGPADLEDDALDQWWESVRSSGLTTAVTHGDYYRGNVLCKDRRIVGIIDWHDASARPLVLELAGATFEFCRNDAHVLHVDRAQAFTRAYQSAGGPLPSHELKMLLPFMRLWVRADARWSIACEGDSESTYVRRQVRAFGELADLRERLL